MCIDVAFAFKVLQQVTAERYMTWSFLVRLIVKKKKGKTSKQGDNTVIKKMMCIRLTVCRTFISKQAGGGGGTLFALEINRIIHIVHANIMKH